MQIKFLNKLKLLRYCLLLPFIVGCNITFFKEDSWSSLDAYNKKMFIEMYANSMYNGCLEGLLPFIDKLPEHEQKKTYDKTCLKFIISSKDKDLTIKLMDDYYDKYSNHKGGDLLTLQSDIEVFRGYIEKNNFNTPTDVEFIKEFESSYELNKTREVTLDRR